MKSFEYENANFLGARYSDVTRNVNGHSHDYYELNFLTRGKTKMRIDGKIFEYESYDFLLIPPGMDHLLYESAYEKFDNYVIWFEEGGEKAPANQIIKLHDYDGTVQFLCSQIYQNYIHSGTENKELIDLYLKAVLWHMKRGLILDTRRRATNDGELADEAVKYINAHIFHGRLTVENVAEAMNVTPAHLARTFKQKFGTSPVKYMNSMRMAEAKRLLKTERLQVKEIAARLYYTDPLYFSKQFTQLIGISPSEYRKLHIAEESEH